MAFMIWNNSVVAPQILDFFPKVGVAGETVLVELTGRRFPEIIPIATWPETENKTFVECTLGGDGYRAPAVLLSDKRAMCNISSPVAGNFNLGLIFANMLQVSARRKMNFGKVGVEQAPQVLDLTDSTTEETTDFRYWIWEGYVITFSVPPKNGMACRLYPGGEQVFAALLTNTSLLACLCTYSLQVAEAPDFQFATLPLTIEVFEQPQILQISPTEVLPGEGYTLSLLATRFPEQRLTFSSFRCQVHAIGPGTHPVEVLVDGRHQSRSEPQVFLRVHPEEMHEADWPPILPELDWWHDVCTSGPPGLAFFDVTEEQTVEPPEPVITQLAQDADNLAALCPGCGIVCDENAEHRLPGSDGRSGMGALRRVLYPRVRAVTPTAAIVNLVSQLPPMVSARCDFQMKLRLEFFSLLWVVLFEMYVREDRVMPTSNTFDRFGSAPAQIYGSMVHCMAPKLREEARISLRLRLTLRTASTDMVQRLVVTVQEDFRPYLLDLEYL
ncbi:hypothetical protein AK812_SmicGene1687 [Symbiodinium microadriaticum]|uniref:Uncharacterized protein n=1 Tax=Symbiodinium microadriaticum TaxID=2951 RepID=A0A1Q9F3D0_SYMMI|nr:hypothetical protein AK812_SmicGene1687 [Symbiodinium microadriaticum]